MREALIGQGRHSCQSRQLLQHVFARFRRQAITVALDLVQAQHHDEAVAGRTSSPQFFAFFVEQLEKT